MESKGTINQYNIKYLPAAILNLIFNYFDSNTLMQFKQVSTYFHTLITNSFKFSYFSYLEDDRRVYGSDHISFFTQYFVFQYQKTQQPNLPPIIYRKSMTFNLAKLGVKGVCTLTINNPDTIKAIKLFPSNVGHYYLFLQTNNTLYYCKLSTFEMGNQPPEIKFADNFSLAFNLLMNYVPEDAILMRGPRLFYIQDTIFHVCSFRYSFPSKTDYQYPIDNVKGIDFNHYSLVDLAYDDTFNWEMPSEGYLVGLFAHKTDVNAKQKIVIFSAGQNEKSNYKLTIFQVIDDIDCSVCKILRYYFENASYTYMSNQNRTKIKFNAIYLFLQNKRIDDNDVFYFNFDNRKLAPLNLRKRCESVPILDVCFVNSTLYLLTQNRMYSIQVRDILIKMNGKQMEVTIKMKSREGEKFRLFEFNEVILPKRIANLRILTQTGNIITETIRQQASISLLSSFQHLRKNNHSYISYIVYPSVILGGLFALGVCMKMFGIMTNPVGISFYFGILVILLLLTIAIHISNIKNTQKDLQKKLLISDNDYKTLPEVENDKGNTLLYVYNNNSTLLFRAKNPDKYQPLPNETTLTITSRAPQS